ncbi:thiamine phosphate synthase [Nannocystis pusilla]|uniref:Thiamine-phosphate synthase n=1 Tax=Nannocystis pusilla TaxID=889268 RepID=A0A9X3J1W8_9BACT|nr:thiamine phosphate synthase [Nannocystis pusilla]MCY1011144.1 thiamine phosphate synthase [Nannocystis pusilla]
MRARVPAWRGLYAILDLPHAGGLAPAAALAGLLGVMEIGPEKAPTIVQLRAKQADAAERGRLVRELAPMVRAAGALLIVDDDVEAATAAADGVHLGQEDMAERTGDRPWSEWLAELRRAAPPGFLIGLSTHTRAQVLHAASLDVDYIGFGPILRTRSKLAQEPAVGFEELEQACAMSPHPVVAIGGLGAEEALRCARAGAAGAAMIGALVGSTQAEVRARATELATAIRHAIDALGQPSSR